MSEDQEVGPASDGLSRDSFLKQPVSAKDGIPEEARILSAIWHRNRLIIQSDSIERANDRLFEMMCFVPQYRQFVLCGQIPKRARYFINARLIDTEDFGSLRTAFQQSFGEEESEVGVPPIQIIFFNAGEEAFRDVLRFMDRGWIATTTCEKRALDLIPVTMNDEMRSAGEAILFVDPCPDDLSLEERILEDTQSIGRRGKEFVVQMKQSEVHLAFQALRDEVESGKCLTQSYISEIYHLKEKTLKKIIEIGKREERLDLSGYIIETHPRIIEFLRELSSINEISLAAVFNGGVLIGYANYRDVFFPVANFLRIIEKLNGSVELQGGNNHFQYIELNAAAKDIHIYKSRFYYGFVLEKGAKSALFRVMAEKLIKNLQETIRDEGPECRVGWRPGRTGPGSVPEGGNRG